MIISAVLLAVWVLLMPTIMRKLVQEDQIERITELSDGCEATALNSRRLTSARADNESQQ